MYAGHIYNAARQENLLTGPWKDMEMLIALQSPEKFFVGDRPQGLEEYFKRFSLSLGYSATMFAKNRRKNAPVASAKGPRTLSELAVVSRLFKGRYSNNERSVSWTRETIEPIIESKFDGSDDESSDAPDDAHKDTTQGRRERKANRVKPAASGAQIRMARPAESTMSMVEFLERLANTLHAESIELNFDYFSMHHRCWMLLRSLNQKCKPQLLKIYGEGYLEKESQLPFVVGYIFMACTGTSHIAGLLSPKLGVVDVTSRLLVTAAGAINTMIEQGAGEIVIKKMEMELGTEVDMSAL